MIFIFILAGDLIILRVYIYIYIENEYDSQADTRVKKKKEKKISFDACYKNHRCSVSLIILKPTSC